MTRLVALGALVLCLAAPRAAAAQPVLRARQVVRAGAPVDRCGREMLRGYVLEPGGGGAAIRRPQLADGSILFMAGRVSPGLTRAQRTVVYTTFGWRDGCWGPAPSAALEAYYPGQAVSDPQICGARCRVAVPHAWLPTVVVDLPALPMYIEQNVAGVSALYESPGTGRHALRHVDSRGVSHDADLLPFDPHDVPSILPLGDRFLVWYSSHRGTIFDARTGAPVGSPQGLGDADYDLATCRDGAGTDYFQFASAHARVLMLGAMRGTTFEYILAVREPSGRLSCLRSGGFVLIEDGGRELVYYDGRSAQYVRVTGLGVLAIPNSVTDTRLWLSRPGDAWYIDLSPILPARAP